MAVDFEKRMIAAFAARGITVPLTVLTVTDSTNTLAKRAAAEKGVRDGFFIAQRQSGGRGRLGRSFLSDDGGLYLSYLTRPDTSPEDALMLTVRASVAAAEAIEALCGASVGIKWVNDLHLGGKKIAGILTEGAVAEGGESLLYAVIGIGINVHARAFPPELADIATDIEESLTVSAAAELSARLIEIEKRPREDYMAAYRRASVCIGRRVRVITPTCEYFARAVDIGERGALHVIREGEESITELSTGEISIRFDNN